MTDVLARLRAAIHLESAAIAPQTSELIEAAKAAIEEIENLRARLGPKRLHADTNDDEGL